MTTFKNMQLDTLEKLRSAKHYNQWVYQLCCPYLGQRILEIGGGIGTMTDFFLKHGEVLATDVEPKHLKYLKQRWVNQGKLKTELWDINRPAPESVKRFRPDTVVGINILEHIQDDFGVLQKVFELLPRQGRLVLFLPALPGLFGKWDERLGHFRRYQRKSLQALMQAARFQVEQNYYVNFLGIFGWWWNSKVLQREYFPKTQIRFYEFLVPLLAQAERWLKPALGQSLFCVGKKPGAA